MSRHLLIVTRIREVHPAFNIRRVRVERVGHPRVVDFQHCWEEKEQRSEKKRRRQKQKMFWATKSEENRFSIACARYVRIRLQKVTYSIFRKRSTCKYLLILRLSSGSWSNICLLQVIRLRVHKYFFPTLFSLRTENLDLLLESIKKDASLR